MRVLTSLCTLILLFCKVLPAQQQYELFNCEYIPDSTYTRNPLDEVAGTLKILWVLCCADSASIAPDHEVPVDGDCDSARIRYASTYSMPTWTSWMFNQGEDWSLSRFFFDQSNGLYNVIGEIPSAPDGGIFRCDPDPIYRPVKPFGSCGNAVGDSFYVSIMRKVDDVVDFNEFDLDGNGEVDFVLLNPYGHFENGRLEGLGGVGGIARLQCGFLTNDTLQDGTRIYIPRDNGAISWSPSEQSLSMNDEWPDVGYPDSVTAAYWSAHGCAAHEIGHVAPLSLRHTHNWGHQGFGSYDIMGYFGSFQDPENCNGPSYTGPYDPVNRTHFGWTNPYVVDQPLFSFTLRDNLETSECLLLRGYRTSDPSLEQYFIVTSNTKRTIWEDHWPNYGIQVYHYDAHGDRSQQVDPVHHKMIDIELASGMWDWTMRYEEADTSWDYPDLLLTGERNNIANTKTGKDSFDIEYFHTNSFPVSGWNWSTKGHGLASDYFTENHVFNDTSNPSSCLYTRGINAEQSIPSMVHLEVLNVDPFSGTCTVNAWTRHWSGSVSVNAFWHDSVVVDDDLYLETGTVLTIMEGTEVMIAPDAKLEIDGVLDIQGTEGNRVVFDCADPDETWAGIKFNSSSQANRIEYVTIRNADIGTVVDAGRLDVSHCIFENCEYGMVYLEAYGTVDNSRFLGNDRFGAFIFDGAVNLMNNDIAENGQGGVRLIAGNHRLHGNLIGSNGIAHDSLRRSWAGIESLGALAQMSCNTVVGNQGPGLFLFAGGFAAMHGNGWNEIHENMRGEDLLQTDFGQIYLQGGVATLANGLNCIDTPDDTGWLIHTSSAPIQSMNYQYNCWGTNDTSNIESRLPEYTAFVPFYLTSYNCGTVPMGGGGGYDYALMTFDAAWELEHQGLFYEAYVYYDSLITFYGVPPFGNHAYLKIALDRSAFCKSAASWTWPDVRDYFLQLAADSSKDTMLVNQCLTSAAWCLVNMGRFADAENELQHLVDVSIKEEDIIRNQLHLILVDLAQLREQGMFNVQADPDRPRATLDEADGSSSLRTYEVAERIHTVANRLDALIGGQPMPQAEPPSSTLLTVPVKFALYQNHPNPFNPSTTISFDIPEVSQTSLVIYDVLGRTVETLLDKQLLAGNYHIMWNAEALPSGVYFYRLTSGDFVDVKKTILLK